MITFSTGRRKGGSLIPRRVGAVPKYPRLFSDFGAFNRYIATTPVNRRSATVSHLLQPGYCSG